MAEQCSVLANVQAGSIALVCLAAGAGRRFGGHNDDKLLQPLGAVGGCTVLSASIAAAANIAFARRVAVVGPKHAARRELLMAAGFDVLINPNADAGMGTSLAKAATAALMDDANILHAMIILGDMPMVRPAHILSLVRHAGDKPVMSALARQTMPPCMVPRSMFGALATLNGDQGLRSIMPQCQTVAFASEIEALDIDTPGDLERIKQFAA